MSPNTPRFDLVAGNTAGAQRTLEEMARVNQGTLPKGTLVSNIPVSVSTLKTYILIYQNFMISRWQSHKF